MLHLCLLDCLIFLWQWRFSFLASSFFTSKISKLAGLLEETTLWKKFLLKYFYAILLLQTSFIQANWFSNVELIEPENMYFLAGKRKKYQENSWLFQNTIYRLNLFFFPCIYVHVFFFWLMGSLHINTPRVAYDLTNDNILGKNVTPWAMIMKFSLFKH